MARKPNGGNSTSGKAADAAVLALQPLANLLLDHGLGVPELYGALKWAFVQEAARRQSARNQPLNASRIAAVTGLTRHEVARLLKARLAPEAPRARQRQRSNRVLLGWHTDATFLTREGKPRALPYEGEVSFSALSRQYSGDIPPRAMLDELLALGAVKETSSDVFKPLGRTVQRGPASGEAIVEIGRRLNLVAQAITAGAGEAEGLSAFQDLAMVEGLEPAQALELVATLNRRSENFFELSQRVVANAPVAAKPDAANKASGSGAKANKPRLSNVGVFISVIHQQEAEDEGNAPDRPARRGRPLRRD
ncbi:MAG: hypothetical protein RJB26_525 [Pseudomonadota bacterium]